MDFPSFADFPDGPPMNFPSFADFGDHASDYDSSASMRSTLNYEFKRGTTSFDPREIPVLYHSIRRVSSDARPESTTSSGSSDSWRESNSPVANQLRRHHKVAGTPGPLKQERPARAVLSEWPTVDTDDVGDATTHLLGFDLDPTTLHSDVLCHLAMKMFVSAGLPPGLEADRVRRFILAIRAAMPDNPYHNFYHVFDVMQTTNALATCTGTMARLDAWERFGLLSAALCHDLEHPGVTSAFLSKAGDSRHGGYKNIVFKDALLEKHHALRALGVMVERDIGILEGLSSEQYYQFRSSVSKIILATDMNRHTQYFDQIQEFAARRAEDPAAEMDKQLAMELMVKCADISNVVKPVAVARRWALRVTDEFFVQGDAERAMGMEVSPTCDRFSKSRVDLQIGFIDHLAAPLFTLLAAAFPPARNGPGESPPAREGFETPLEQLRHNRALYALCSDADLETARDWGETASRVAPSSLRAASQQLSSDEATSVKKDPPRHTSVWKRASAGQ